MDCLPFRRRQQRSHKFLFRITSVTWNSSWVSPIIIATLSPDFPLLRMHSNPSKRVFCAAVLVKGNCATRIRARSGLSTLLTSNALHSKPQKTFCAPIVSSITSIQTSRSSIMSTHRMNGASQSLFTKSLGISCENTS